MLGFPHETREDVEQTIEAALYLDPDYIQISYAVPIPGTELYADSLAKGYLDPNLPYEKYDSTAQIINTGDLTNGALKTLYNQFWKKFYLRPRVFWRELRWACTSWKETKRLLRGAWSFYQRVYGPHKI